MANEAVLKLKLEEPWDWIVHDDIAVEKGTLMKISGVGTAAASEADDSGVAWAGVARREKIVDDGRTRLALLRRGVCDMKNCPAGATISEGSWVCISGVNTIRLATAAELVTGAGIGITREDIAADGTGEVILGGY